MDKNTSQSPFREKHTVTLASGLGTFAHAMTSIEDYSIKIAKVEGKGNYFQEEDAGDVIAATGIDSGGVSAADDGFITRVEASLSSQGVDGATVGIYARADDGGVFGNEDAAAVSATANDMTLLPAVPAQNDAYYIGMDDINFQSIRMMVAGTNAVVTTGQSTITIEYYNGSWVPLVGLIDGTNGLTDLSAGTTIQWTPQADWIEVAINIVTCFWIRIVENHASPTFSQVPIGSQISLGIGVVVDVHAGGTTIFTTQKNRVVIFDDSTNGKQLLVGSSNTIEAGTFAGSGSLTVDVDLVATGTAAQDLVVTVYGTYSDAQATAIPEQFAITFGADNIGQINSSAAASDSVVDIILHGKP